MRRETLIRLADAVEDAMIEAGWRDTAEKRRIWWACLPLWDVLREVLRAIDSEDRSD